MGREDGSGYGYVQRATLRATLNPGRPVRTLLQLPQARSDGARGEARPWRGEQGGQRHHWWGVLRRQEEAVKSEWK